MKLSNKPVFRILIICFIFCIISSMAYSSCVPSCDACECCRNGNCQSGCCGSKVCCDGKRCYDPETAKCCGRGDGSTCPKDEICCNEGGCAESCEIIDGENCSTPPGTNLCESTCVMGGGDCGISSVKEWSGITEQICSPRGCSSDCHETTHWCWKEYACAPSGSSSWFDECTSYGVTPTGTPVFFPFHVCYSIFPIPTTCESCEQGEQIDEHDVEYDSCN